MDRAEIEGRIRFSAKGTDELITKLDTLTSRIETAKANENQELVEYYERQFAEASVEFMDGVECILDDWYLLQGEPRPPADEELLTPDKLDAIHRDVIGIVQGLGAPARLGEFAETPRPEPEISTPTERSRGPKHRVDLTG